MLKKGHIFLLWRSSSCFALEVICVEWFTRNNCSELTLPSFEMLANFPFFKERNNSLGMIFGFWVELAQKSCTTIPWRSTTSVNWLKRVLGWGLLELVFTSVESIQFATMNTILLFVTGFDNTPKCQSLRVTLVFVGSSQVLVDCPDWKDSLFWLPGLLYLRWQAWWDLPECTLEGCRHRSRKGIFFSRELLEEQEHLNAYYGLFGANLRLSWNIAPTQCIGHPSSSCGWCQISVSSGFLCLSTALLSGDEALYEDETVSKQHPGFQRCLWHLEGARIRNCWPGPYPTFLCSSTPIKWRVLAFPCCSWVLLAFNSLGRVVASVSAMYVYIYIYILDRYLDLPFKKISLPFVPPG